MWRLFPIVVCAVALGVAQPPGRRDVSLIVANGIVITVDGSHRVIQKGSVAIDGRDIVAVDTSDAIAARYSAARYGRRRGLRDHARADQHAHARADGDVPRARGRSGAHGLAAGLHLPGRSEDSVARARPRRHASRGPRNDRVGDDDVRRHVLLRGGDRARDEGRRIAWGPGRDDHSVPRPRRKDTRRRHRAYREIHRRVQRRRVDYAGHCAALDVHPRRRDVEGVPCAGRPAARSGHHPSLGNQG